MDTEKLYQTVQTLSTESQRGHFGNDDFNRIQNLAQSKLMDYYVKQLEQTGTVIDSLSPFITESILSLSNGAYPVQQDFRSDVRGSRYQYSENPDSSGPVQILEKPADYIRPSQIKDIVDCPIRGANFAKGRLYYTIEAGQIKLYPTTLTGKFIHKYVRNPNEIVRATTPDTVNQVENYDAGSSIHPEWLDKDFDNMVDLCLWLTGMTVRSNPIVQQIIASANLQTVL